MGHCPVFGNVYGEVLGCKGDANDEGTRLAASNAGIEFMIHMSTVLFFSLKWRGCRYDRTLYTLPFLSLLSATVFIGSHYLLFRQSIVVNLSSDSDDVCMHDLNVCISVSKKEARRWTKAPKLSLTTMVRPDVGKISTSTLGNGCCSAGGLKVPTALSALLSGKTRFRKAFLNGAELLMRDLCA